MEELSGESKTKEEGMGTCLTDAFRMAGYDQLEIPEWIDIEAVPDICEGIGLRWHGGGETMFVGLDQPVIVLYKTRPGKGHAEYLKDSAGLIIATMQKTGKVIAGIIEL